MRPAQAHGEGREPLPFSFDALILDLDGVLADTEPLHQKAWDAVLEGVPPETLAAERRRWVGMPSAEIVKGLVRTFGLTTPPQELLARKRATYRSLISVPGNLVPFPGVREELARWKGFPLAVATAGIREEALRVLEILGLGGVFDPVVTWSDVPQGKPAPDCYLRAAEILAVPISRCVAIEDSENGVEAAVTAGARVLVVSSHALAAGLRAGVERVFPTTVDALEWLRG